MSHLTLPIIWLRERTGEVVMMIHVALDVLAQYSSGPFFACRNRSGGGSGRRSSACRQMSALTISLYLQA